MNRFLNRFHAFPWMRAVLATLLVVWPLDSSVPATAADSAGPAA